MYLQQTDIVTRPAAASKVDGKSGRSFDYQVSKDLNKRILN